MGKDTSKPMSPQKAYRRMMQTKLNHAWKLVRRRVYQTAYLDDDDLEEYEIKVGEDISLDPDVIDFGIRFCEPFPASKLEEIWKTRWQYDDPPIKWPQHCELSDGWTIAYYVLYALGDRLVDTHFAASSLWYTAGQGTRHLRMLYKEHLGDSIPGWSMSKIHRLRDRSSTHTGCTLHDNSTDTPDGRLRSSEMACAISLMRGVLKKDRKREFKVAPIFVYSFSNRHARFIQAHFDGNHIIVRKTGWLDFDQDIRKSVDLFLRWMMCTPIGSTRFSPLPNEGGISGSAGRQDSDNKIALQYKGEETPKIQA